MDRIASSESGGQKGNPNPTLIDLDKPEKLSNVMKKDLDDCLPCRLMGKAPLYRVEL